MSFPRYERYKDSGVEWLGEVPEHWNISKFRHVFSESPEKIEDQVVGEMLSVSGYRGIEVKKYEDENQRRLEENLVGYRIVRVGQLVVNTMWLNYAGLGVSALEGHVSPAYRAYWINESMNKHFIHHLMRSEFYVRGYTKYLTGVRPNSLQMSRDDLMAFPIVIPPPTEQESLSMFLDQETAKIDALIEEQRRLIELLKEKRQAVISRAVTKGIDPAMPMKHSKVESFGLVPSHWSVGPLKRFAKVIDCKHVTVEFVESGKPIVSIRELKNDYIEIGEAKLASDQDWDYLRENRIPVPGDLIICRNASVGAVGEVTPGMEICMGQDVCLVRPSAPSGFNLYMLISTSVRKQIDALLVGATIRRLNVEAIRNLVVTYPPTEESFVIAKYLQLENLRFMSLIQEAAHATNMLQERRSALISAAVTGKIDVRNYTPKEAE